MTNSPTNLDFQVDVDENFFVGHHVGHLLGHHVSHLVGHVVYLHVGHHVQLQAGKYFFFDFDIDIT